MTSAAVYGTGSWGTAYASVLADAGTSVTMWGRRQEVVDQINAGTNEDYLPELRLPSTIRATTDPFEAAAGADIVVLAVPSQTPVSYTHLDVYKRQTQRRCRGRTRSRGPCGRARAGPAGSWPAAHP